MQFKYMSRGMRLGEFRDSYGEYCSIQESSAVDPHIWLGIDKDREGKPYKMFEGKPMSVRMHLSQQTVYQLLPLLIYFAKNGTLPTEEQEDQEAQRLLNDPEYTDGLLRAYHLDPGQIGREVADFVKELLEEYHGE